MPSKSNQSRGRFNRTREPDIRYNRYIRAREVRLIGPEGENLGVVDTRDALQKATEFGMDLVEISPNAEPPVCRIMDYGKHKYELDRRKKDARKKQTVMRVKEIKFHANVEDHDYETKMRHMRDFIAEGNRVKCTLWFRGRENTHPEIGFQLYERIKLDMAELAHAEQEPKLTGKNLSMLLCPGNRRKK